MRFIQSNTGPPLIEQRPGKNSHEDKRGEHGKKAYQQRPPGFTKAPVYEDKQQQQEAAHGNNSTTRQQHHTVRGEGSEEEEGCALAEIENSAANYDLLNKVGKENRPGRYVLTVFQAK